MSEVKYLLPMVDGGITQVFTNRECNSSSREYESGTDEFYETYIDEFRIVLSHTASIFFSKENRYEYALTEGYLMNVLLPNYDLIRGMTEKEFCDWFRRKMEEDYFVGILEYE